MKLLLDEHIYMKIYHNEITVSLTSVHWAAFLEAWAKCLDNWKEEAISMA